MSIGAIFFFGVLVSLIFLSATILLVLSEAADPNTASEETLTDFEKKMIGERRKRAKEEIQSNTRGEKNE